MVPTMESLIWREESKTSAKMMKLTVVAVEIGMVGNKNK